MSKLYCALLCLGLALGSSPARAQDAPPAPTSSEVPAATAAPAAKKDDDTVSKVRKYLLTRPSGQPSRLERLIVASVASVIAAGALAGGVGMGVWAYLDYQCLKGVSSCNKGRTDNEQIKGTNFLRYRADGERKALLADMLYLAAITGAAVAVLGVASAFWPAGWWPFASDEQPADIPPRQVVTEIPPVQVDQPAPITEPAPAPDAAPAPEEAAPPPATDPSAPPATTGAPGAASTTP